MKQLEGLKLQKNLHRVVSHFIQLWSVSVIQSVIPSESQIALNLVGLQVFSMEHVRRDHTVGFWNHTLWYQ